MFMQKYSLFLEKGTVFKKNSMFFHSIVGGMCALLSVEKDFETVDLFFLENV